MDFVLDLTMYSANSAVWTDSQSSKCYTKFWKDKQMGFE